MLILKELDHGRALLDPVGVWGSNPHAPTISIQQNGKSQRSTLFPVDPKRSIPFVRSFLLLSDAQILIRTCSPHHNLRCRSVLCRTSLIGFLPCSSHSYRIAWLNSTLMTLRIFALLEFARASPSLRCNCLNQVSTAIARIANVQRILVRRGWFIPRKIPAMAFMKLRQVAWRDWSVLLPNRIVAVFINHVSLVNRHSGLVN